MNGEVAGEMATVTTSRRIRMLKEKIMIWFIDGGFQEYWINTTEIEQWDNNGRQIESKPGSTQGRVLWSEICTLELLTSFLTKATVFTRNIQHIIWTGEFQEFKE